MKKKHLLSIIFCVGFLISLNISAGDIFNAIETGDLKEVERLINKDEVDVNQTNNNGETPLYVACHKNNLKIVKFLLENGANINKSNKDGATVLFFACYRNNLEMVKLLLINKADVNQVSVWDHTPVCFACANNNLEITQLLVRHGAEIKQMADEKHEDKEMQKYLTLVEQFDDAINKIIFINKQKNNKYLKDILKRAFFKSVQDILKRKKKYKTNLLFELYEKSKLGKYKWLKKAIKKAFQIEKEVSFENLLDSKLCVWTKKEKKNIETFKKIIDMHNKDFHERIEYVLNV